MGAFTNDPKTEELEKAKKPAKGEPPFPPKGKEEDEEAMKGAKGAKGLTPEEEEALKEKEKACGGKPEEEMKEEKGAKAAKPPVKEGEGTEEEEYPYPNAKSKKKTQKSEDGEGDIIVIKADGTVEVNQEAIAKRKMFTSGRMKTVKETVLTLAQMLREVDPESASEVYAALKELPGDVSVQRGVTPVATTKSEAPAPAPVETEEVKTLKSQVADLTKRLDDIEKTRPVSKSVTTEATDDKVEKRDALWKGLI